ncbi:MAG: YfcE family phosphodiesterase [Planctomycetaceae bacterium]
MKILVVADVHANWAALSAIQESFDACLMLGDLVDYGTDPQTCIDWSRQHATAAVRGNHDHAVAQRVAVREGGGFRRLARATRSLHWDVLDSSRMRYLARLPVTQHVPLGGHRFFLVHATPRDPLDEYLGVDPPIWEERVREIEADFICVGHTHQQFHIEVGGKQIINPGSVGQPRDGDPRAAYAVIEDGQVSLRRVEYDIDAAVRQMRGTGVEPWVVELSETLLRRGGLTREEMDAFL